MATTTATAPIAASPRTAPPARMTTPFDFVSSLSQEVDRMLGEFGLRRPRPFMPAAGSQDAAWMPDLELTEDNGKLRARLDLPGLEKKDVKIDVTDDALIVAGERRQNEEQKGKGYYRSERSYGRFFRSIGLPEGARPETAKATFANGVLEIVMDTNGRPQAAGRRVEISDPVAPV